jgi:NADPH-dependent glutamate synthase beta subunit-like oxidoreductase
MALRHTDLTSPTDLRAHPEGTGPIRSRHARYVDFLPPCNHACPAGENIQAWLGLAQAGKHEEAWRALTNDNPFPAVMGRVCYHPCESACNRAEIDTPVSVHSVERFLGDTALEQGWQFDKPAASSGKKVLIVGAGPSGMAAAFHLARLGHEVEIRDAGPAAGGMMHIGIPAYRLPRNILEAEVKRIENLGVKITLNHKVTDLMKEKEAGSFDAVFTAVGAHLSKKIDIPQRDAGKILDAISFLKEVEEGNPPKLGRRVAVYGGGNTAMDAARTAKRLGYEPLIIYRRDRDHMPAHDFEADEAMAEGVKINWLRTITEIEDTNFKVEVMALNERGKPVPTGEYETLEADALILALGQNAETAFLKEIPGIAYEWDTVKVGPDMQTGAAGIFAGGDMAPGERTVTVAIGHGKKAARNIDAYLRETSYEKGATNPIVGFERLHVWYKTFAPQSSQAVKPVAERVEDFSEIIAGLSEHDAVYEAQRCLSCGNCFECDACYAACPEDAVIKLGPGKKYRIDLNTCTGCAVCFEQCPCHAIEMETE